MRIPDGAALAAFIYVVLAVSLSRLGIPSPALFAAMCAAGSLAARRPSTYLLPTPLRQVGMALVGVAAGSSMDSGTLSSVLSHPVAVVAGVVATLAATLFLGQVLRLDRNVSTATACFASIAGGASGVSLMAREFGADDTVVMSVQYLRVVVVLVSVPLVAPMLVGHSVSTHAVGSGSQGGSAYLFTAAAAVSGLVLARALPFPASAIIWSMLTASVLSVTEVFPYTDVPPWILWIAYSLVGIWIGIGFTKGRLRKLVRLMPLALLQLILSVLACGAIGLVLAEALAIPRLDGYLATSPGGLPAVTAVAVDSGQEVGLILTMQTTRIFLALLLTPLVAWWLRRRGDSPDGGSGHPPT